MPSRKTVGIGFLGSTLDVGKGPGRWERWRPTVSLCQQPDLVVSRLEVLYQPVATNLCRQITEDIGAVSPETQVRSHCVPIADPWDFEQVYATLHDFARSYPFDPEREEYLVHITTGTHVAQICLFLLTETRHFPAKLVQTSPRGRSAPPGSGAVRIIDLDLSKYDSIGARFRKDFADRVTGLKSGIATRNASFNALIERIEHVAARTADPILLTGPTGAGKSRLARRIYELRKAAHTLRGEFVELNCATLRGDAAMSALFGHKRGAFTGAAQDRPGLLRAADGGMLFLDEIGELGADEQAMMLRALEEKRFLPLGADKEATSDFQLIAGTNRDLARAVREGRFRDDLLARINLWTFRLPALRDRIEDLEPNLDYELEEFARRTGRLVRFNAEARAAYLRFAGSAEARWAGNFRDLAASVTRMGTLAPAPHGRITVETVRDEIARLLGAWAPEGADGDTELSAVLGAERAAALDEFDRIQLAGVLRVCARSSSLSEAGRVLFAASRARRRAINDADRLRKYLARFGVGWGDVRRGGC